MKSILSQGINTIPENPLELKPPWQILFLTKMTKTRHVSVRKVGNVIFPCHSKVRR